MPAKKPAKKAPAKRKPAKKIAVDGIEKIKLHSPKEPIAWRSWGLVTLKSAALIAAGAVAGVWSAGGIDLSPKPIVRNDVLQQSYDADRVSQAKILREYAAQGFVNDDQGRQKATDWFNANRFRNRGPDFRPYTSAVTDHFAAGTLEKFADELEGK